MELPLVAQAFFFICIGFIRRITRYNDNIQTENQLRLTNFSLFLEGLLCNAYIIPIKKWQGNPTGIVAQQGSIFC